MKKADEALFHCLQQKIYRCNIKKYMHCVSDYQLFGQISQNMIKNQFNYFFLALNKITLFSIFKNPLFECMLHQGLFIIVIFILAMSSSLGLETREIAVGGREAVGVYHS